MPWRKDDFLSGQVDLLLDAIHDRWFCIDAMRHDLDKRLWMLPFGDDIRRPCERQIMVTQVKACHVQDTEKVGFYDIDRLILRDNEGCVLQLKCNIPLDLRLEVEPSFLVSVEPAGR